MAADLGETYVRDILNGSSKKPSAAALHQLAPVLKTSIGYLLTGDGPEHVEPVQVRFYVGAGAVVVPIEGDPPLEYVEMPPGAKSVGGAAIVRGTSQMPALREGDTVFWAHEEDPSRLIGLECICILADGRVLVKTLLKGARAGVFTLISHNDAPIQDVEVTAAAPIIWVKRALARR